MERWQQEYLYYAIVFPNPTRQEEGEKSSPCPIAELISTNQSEPTISNWLQLFRYREKSIYGFRNLTTPCLISSDRSLPLLVSSLKVFSGETMKQYLERSWRIVSGVASDEDLNGMVVHSGLCHFMKDGKEYCRKYYKKENSWFGMCLFRLLAEVRVLQDFRKLMYSICIVLRAEVYSPICQLHMKEILSTLRSRDSSEMNEIVVTDNEYEGEEINPLKQTQTSRCTEEDALVQESSNFKTLCHNIDNDAKEALSKEERTAGYDNSKPNYFKSSQLIERMLTYVLPTIPIWSQLILGDLTRHSTKYQKANYDTTRYFIRNPPTTQGYMEAYNKIFKMTTVANFRFRLDELLQRMFTAIEAQQRKFVLQYRVRKQKKVGKRATTLVEEKWSRTSKKTRDDMKKRSSKGAIGNCKTAAENILQTVTFEYDRERGRKTEDSTPSHLNKTNKRKSNTLIGTPRTSKTLKKANLNQNDKKSWKREIKKR
ncbi:putative poly [Apostichopus japonicus]|uniref:Putative poly n=1 Tax=Stichopus japonicus TaxID=307972 RepID=A0A2G8JM56_STIJA|nr:putative poly [Apostichopus japonicus]